MALYEEVMRIAEEQQPKKSIYGVDMAVAFKVLCDKIEEHIGVLKENKSVAVSTEGMRMENVHENRIKCIEEMIEIQSRSGNYDYDPYMHGMANGMIYIHSILTDKEPKYLTAPDKWLKDNDAEEKVLAVYSKDND